MPSKKSLKRHAEIGIRVPPRTNTSRSNTGPNASSIAGLPAGGLLTISSVTPNADRWAAGARNFRCTNDEASNDTAIISDAVPKMSGSRPSVMPRPDCCWRGGETRRAASCR
jgi:hypothetical protein